MTEFASKPTITRAIARQLLDHIEAAAASAGGVGLSAAVCDDAGVLVGLIRTDGGRAHNVTLACQKAETAAGFGLATSAWRTMSDGSPELALGLIGGLGQVALFGGGVPIVVAGQIAGAVGVSGPDENQDGGFAQAAIDALAG